MSVESYSEVGTKISLAGLHDRYNLRESFVQSPRTSPSSSVENSSSTLFTVHSQQLQYLSVDFRMRVLLCSFFLFHRMVAVFSNMSFISSYRLLSRDMSKHFQATVLYLPIMRREIMSEWVDGQVN